TIHEECTTSVAVGEKPLQRSRNFRKIVLSKRPAGRANSHRDSILVQGVFHVPENPLSAPAQRGMTFPAHVVGENPDRIEPWLTPEISQRREPSDRVLTEQFASRPLDLGAPSQSS